MIQLDSKNLAQVLDLKLIKTYHTKKSGDLRAKIELSGRQMSVKCNAKTNTVISASGYALEVVGIFFGCDGQKPRVDFLYFRRADSEKLKFSIDC